MPKQNRVAPDSTIISTSARGTLMGNRGRLHSPKGHVIRQWQTKAWITCLLDFKDRRRQITAPNSYTELFFLDEATAFAAGHRPCAECRRQDFNLFKKLWLAANSDLVKDESIAAFDAVLHNERVTKHKIKLTCADKLANLPHGTMFCLTLPPRQYFVVNKNQVLKWTPAGYESCQSIAGETEVQVLTPRSIVNVFKRGYPVELG